MAVIGLPMSVFGVGTAGGEGGICAKISLAPPRGGLILEADARHSICFD
jgi:hypothetical protein